MVMKMKKRQRRWIVRDEEGERRQRSKLFFKSNKQTEQKEQNQESIIKEKEQKVKMAMRKKGPQSEKREKKEKLPLFPLSSDTSAVQPVSREPNRPYHESQGPTRGNLWTRRPLDTCSGSSGELCLSSLSCRRYFPSFSFSPSPSSHPYPYSPPSPSFFPSSPSPPSQILPFRLTHSSPSFPLFPLLS